MGDGLLHRGLTALLGLSLGCGAPSPTTAHHYAEGSSQICFPAPPHERRAHEGPFARALIVHASAGGARYELARFDLPVSLPKDKQRVLMARVEKGLSARPDVAELEIGTIAHRGTVFRVLSMRLDSDRMGLWWLSFPTPRQMLQVSVVGPRSSRLRAEEFLSSLGDETCSPAR